MCGIRSKGEAVVMAIVVLFDNVVPEQHFLRSKLNVNYFSDLFLTHSYYSDVLQALGYFDDADIVIEGDTYEGTVIQDALKATLEDVAVAVSDTSRLVYVNPAFYIADLDLAKTTHKKLMLMSEPGFVMHGDDLMMFSIPFEDLSLYPNRIEPRKQDAILRLDDEVYSLLDVQALQQVFSSSFRARHFNNVVRDKYMITKSSSHKEKLEAEYHFLSHVPETIKVFFPRVSDLTISETQVTYQIERVPCFDVGRLMIQGALDETRWNSFLVHLDHYFNAIPRQKVAHSDFKQHMELLFIEKLNDRFSLLKTVSFFEKLDALWRSNTGHSIGDFVDQYCAVFTQELDRFMSDELVFSHGDLCFSNILFDSEMDIFKCIDPRGSSNERPPFMPIWYDLAKLSHSVFGRYDILAHDLMTVVVEPSLTYALDQAVESDYAVVQRGFTAWLDKHGFDMSFLRLCETSLFLSMMPFHSESPDRVLCQLITAKQSFDAALGKGFKS